MTRNLKISGDLSLPSDTVTSTIVVYGGKGMGKTNFGSVLVEELVAAKDRLSVIDPMGVWWGLRHSADGKGPGIEVLILGGIHGDIPIEPTAGAVVADLVVDEDANVVVDISRWPNGMMWSIGERVRFVTDYMKRIYQRQGEKRRPLMQVLDEAARFAPQTIRKGDEEVAACMGAVAVLVEEGRNVGIGCTLLTQRSARLNKDVAELADCMIAFRTPGPNSRRAVLDWLGENVEKERLKDLDQKVRSLPRGHSLVVSPGWLAIEDIVKIRMRKTFDSSATPKSGKERRASGSGAKPNLAKYQARMAETIERIKADDPKELRKQIAALKADLAKAAKAPPASVISDAAMSKAVAAAVRPVQAELSKKSKLLEEAMKLIINVHAKGFLSEANGKIDESKIESAIKEAVRRAIKESENVFELRGSTFEQFRRQSAALLKKMQEALEHDSLTAEVTVTHNQPYTISDSSASREGRRKPPGLAKPGGAPSATGGQVTPRQQRFLDAAATLATLNSEVSRETVAGWVGVHPRGGSVGEELKALADAGLIDLNRGQIRVTDEGMAAAGQLDPAEAIDRAKAGLSARQRRFFDLICAAYPNETTREDIAAACELHPRGGSLGEDLGRLVGRGLVDARRGRYRARDFLFLKEPSR